MNDQQVVENIINLLGGQHNIVSVTNCMTRLRVVVKADDQVKAEELKNAEKVLGLVHDRVRSYEVVVGPGNSRKYADICHDKGLSAASADSDPGGNASGDDWKQNKEAIKAGQKNNKVKQFLKTLGDIFVPMIPGIIAAGLCAGFASLISTLVPDFKNSGFWNITYMVLTMINVSFMTYITAWAGYRAAEVFGATPILGGMLGMITSLSNIDDIAKVLGLFNNDSPLQSILKSGKGGVLAVICGVFILAKVEKFVRKKMPASLDIVLTPLITLIICVIPYVLIIMPVLGIVSNGIVWVFSKACMSESVIVRILVGYASAALFLPLVASGMHHGMVALYTVQLQAMGFVTLYPALAMGGAGQVGAAIAILMVAKKIKHEKLISVIKGALPAGFLGVGEPLIYGVTLPMGRPFLTAGLGAGFGGALVMLFQVASTTWGPSGLLGVFVMTAGKGGPVMSMAMYLLGLAVSYVMSFIITKAVIREAEVAEALGGIQPAGNNAAAVAAASGTAGDSENNSDAEKKEDKADAVKVESKAGIKETEKVSSAPACHRTVSHGETVQFGFTPTIHIEHVIKDKLGIHARPAGELAGLVNKLGCDVMIENGEHKASAKSVLELMMLGAAQGSRLVISVSGSDAEKAAQLLKQFLDEKL